MFNASEFVYGLVDVWHCPAGFVCLEGSHSVWRGVDRGKEGKLVCWQVVSTGPPGSGLQGLGNTVNFCFMHIYILGLFGLLQQA